MWQKHRSCICAVVSLLGHIAALCRQWLRSTWCEVIALGAGAKHLWCIQSISARARRHFWKPLRLMFAPLGQWLRDRVQCKHITVSSSVVKRFTPRKTPPPHTHLSPSHTPRYRTEPTPRTREMTLIKSESSSRGNRRDFISLSFIAWQNLLNAPLLQSQLSFVYLTPLHSPVNFVLLFFLFFLARS